MAKIGSANITDQPRAREIHNSFQLMGNEKFLYEWTAERKTCGCGHTYYSTLTDTRVLFRQEESYCCCCCAKKETLDGSIFLRDIADMSEVTINRNSCWNFSLRCCFCFCRSPPLKSLELRGVFGTEQLYTKDEDIEQIRNEIPINIGNHKIVIHQKI